MPLREGTRSELEGVLAQMKDCEQRATRNSGVYVFAKLYGRVTEHVAAGIVGGRFRAPDATARLLIRFAQYFFEPLRNATQPEGPIALPWQKLLGSPPRMAGLRPVHYALLGMNAHINFDLMQATARVIDELPALGVPYRDFARDYRYINCILREVLDEVAPWYIEGDARRGARSWLSRALFWLVTVGRWVAWHNAALLLRLRRRPSTERAWLRVVECATYAVGTLIVSVGPLSSFLFASFEVHNGRCAPAESGQSQAA